MTNKMGLIALGLMMVLLSACGSSDNDTTDSGTTDAVFTSSLLVGKTYDLVFDGDDTTMTFTETVLNFTRDGVPGSTEYTINEKGELEVVNVGDPFILISIAENGDLLVQNSDIETLWVLRTSDVVFTPELLVGKTYLVIDGEFETTITFTETEVNYTENGESGTVPYTIDANGVLVVDGSDMHTLISIEENGDLNVSNEGVHVWTLIS